MAVLLGMGVSGPADAANVAIFSLKLNLKQFKPPPALEGFTSSLKAELARHPGVTVVEREHLSDITSEIALSQSGLLASGAPDGESPALEDVDYLIGGEVTEMAANHYRADLAIREVRSARIVSEGLSGNLRKFSSEAVRMLAHNTVVVITGEGNGIEKRSVGRAASLVTMGLGVCGLAAGGIMRVRGEQVYTDEYQKGDMPLEEFDRRFTRAQSLTTVGEISLGAGGSVFGISAIVALGGRKERTLIRE